MALSHEIRANAHFFEERSQNPSSLSPLSSLSLNGLYTDLNEERSKNLSSLSPLSSLSLNGLYAEPENNLA